jgi:ribonuclease PH
MLILFGSVACAATAFAVWQRNRAIALDLQLFETAEAMREEESINKEKLKVVQMENRILEIENTALKRAMPDNKLDKVLEIMDAATEKDN